MAIYLTKDDIEWILSRYPNMEYDKNLNSIFGELSFKREYLGNKISDTYNIRVFFNNLDKYTKLPKVICESNKIEKIAKKHNIEKSDIHINPDGTFCLSIQGEEENFFKYSFTIKEFFINTIEGFLFQLSYYDKFRKFPWGEYAHGYLGIIEQYAQDDISLQELLKRLSKEELLKVILTNRQSNCLCGSGKKLRKCHQIVFKGINKLKSNFQ